MGNVAEVLSFYLYDPNNINVNVLIRGHRVKEDLIVVADLIKSPAAILAAVAGTVMDAPIQVGDEVTIRSVKDWAYKNKMNLSDDTGCITEPTLISTKLATNDTVVTLTFNQNIDLADGVTTGAAFKARILKSADGGATFTALAAGDTITDEPDGTAATIVITFAAGITDTVIKILADTFAGVNGVNNRLMNRIDVDADAPNITFFPANAAVNIPIATPIYVNFDKVIYNAADGSEIETADLASIVVFKLTDNVGANVAHTAVLSTNKKAIIITPNAALSNNQAYYVAIAVTSVEDQFGNENALAAATWTTVAA